MPNTQNIEKVSELTEKLKKAKAIYFTDYLGLDVTSITDLRRQFYEQDVEYCVAKNTLIKLAAENNKLKGLDEFLSGPTAIAISYDEPTIPARVIKNFTKKYDKPTVKGILFEGQVLKGDQFNRIAALPPRKDLLTILVTMFQSPMVKLVNTLNAPMSNFVGVLKSLKDSKS